jgi:tetratricopeptide (TPR) repeat protein
MRIHRFLTAGATLVIALTLQARDPRVEELLDRGQRAMEAQDFAGANAALSKAESTAVSAGDAESLKRAYFFQARLAEESPKPDVERAVAYYEKALEVDSAFAAAANNLAKLLFTHGRDEDQDRVLELYGRAAAQDGELRPFYLANYAAAMFNTHPPRAVEIYRKAVALYPDDTNLESGLHRIIAPKEAVPELWKLVARDRLQRAQRLALNHLQTPADPETQAQLLSVVVVTLAREHVSPDVFDTLPVACELGKLTADKRLRDGIRAIRRLYDGETLSATSYQWWSTRRQRLTPDAIPAADAFALLARDIADQLGDSHPKKEPYLRLALSVTGGGDPETFLDVAEYFVRQGRQDELRRLMDQYGMELFTEKGQAYVDQDWKKVYRYHVALGTFYSRLGITGDSGDPQSAIFQLEHARMAAERYNQRQPADAASKIVVDAKVIDLLASNYQKKWPDAKRDVDLRLEAADAYAAAGRTSSAQRVVKPLAADPRLEGNDKLRYDKLLGTVPEQKPDPGGSSGVVLDPEISKLAQTWLRSSSAEKKRLSATMKSKGIVSVTEKEVVMKIDGKDVAVKLAPPQ